ncbi:MAG: hypothetical protein HF312_02610 [Ignavibacteria bacterium]|jgi:hypothetical protein|nr:hypothetical protein [Ignavibacteria bacterium]MCU7519077.1 hypothetical protein [Ignavibacteria bacterium]
MNYTTKRKDSIELSVKEKTYDTWDNIHFKSEVTPYSDLEKTFKSKNFSPIIWNGTRAQGNYSYATAFVVDIDKHGWTIEKAEQILKDHNLNYALITSKRHTDEAHRFHILLPFSRPVFTLKNYEEITARIYKDLFPKSDDQVLGGERFIFGSREDSYYSAHFSGENYQVDVGPQINNAWDDEFEVTLPTGESKRATDIELADGETKPIYCPFHDDNSPSAFLAYSGDSFNHFIHCSSCGRTYWKIQSKDIKELRCRDFWSTGTGIFEAGIVNDTFSLELIGEKKFYSKVKVKTKEQKDSYYDYLVQNKDLHRLDRIDYVGDLTVDESEYSADAGSGIFTVKVKAIAERTRDNQFIENYLEEMFGRHKQFIKEWLAVFCYTNYEKLPTIILTGPRGAGKNTFAEMIQAIYPTLSTVAGDIKGSFNPFAEKKFVYIDESASDGKVQYQMLKKFSGQGFVEVNKKYIPQYLVRNNLNIMLLSNDDLPIYVSRDELPTDEKNNQFFVFQVKSRNTFDPRIKEKLIDRLGYYIRTELKNVFENLSTGGYRYSISVPITDEEKKLFNNSLTDIEAEADRVIDLFESRITDPSWQYNAFIKSGLIPSEFFDDAVRNYNVNKVKVIQYFQKKQYLANEKADKYQQINGRRPYSYKLGKIWLDLISRQPNYQTPKVPVDLFTDRHLNGQS